MQKRTAEPGSPQPREMRQGWPPRPGRIKGVAMKVDDDQIDSLISDVAVGAMRRKEGFPAVAGSAGRRRTTDVHVAAILSADSALQSALGGAASAAIPPEWTPGYAVASDPEKLGRNEEGNQRIEGEWNLDPASAGLIDAQFRRTVVQAQNSAPALAALQTAYVQSQAFFLDMINSGRNIHYDFRTTLSKKPGGVQQARSIPWVTAVRYEIASRTVDPVWAALRMTQEGAAEAMLAPRMRENVRALMDQFRVLYPQIAPVLGEITTTLIREGANAARFYDYARQLGVRLILPVASMDPENVLRRHGGDVIVPRRHRHRPQERVGVDISSRRRFLVESVFFGRQHAEIERLIMNTMVMDEGLRYMFDPGSLVRVFAHFPVFAYDMERVRVRFLKEEATEFKYGLRITLPPAPPGYRRDNVVMLFRSQITGGGGPEETEEEATEEYGDQADIAGEGFRTDAIVLGRIPDNQVYHDPADEQLLLREGAPPPPIRTIAELPASFVLFHSGGDTLETVDMNWLRHGIVVDDIDGDGGGGVGQRRWESVFDLAWLEMMSSSMGVSHAFGNRTFRDRMRAYFDPTTEIYTDRMRVELFVENVAQPETVQQGRLQRRTTTARQFRGARHVPGMELEGSRAYVSYFPTPQSMASMKRFDLPRPVPMTTTTTTTVPEPEPEEGPSVGRPGRQVVEVGMPIEPGRVVDVIMPIDEREQAQFLSTIHAIQGWTAASVEEEAVTTTTEQEPRASPSSSPSQMEGTEEEELEAMLEEGIISSSFATTTTTATATSVVTPSPHPPPPSESKANVVVVPTRPAPPLDSDAGFEVSLTDVEEEEKEEEMDENGDDGDGATPPPHPPADSDVEPLL